MNASYSLHQQISDNFSSIHYVDITGDGSWLLAIDYKKAMVYKLNTDNNFDLLQVFILKNS